MKVYQIRVFESERGWGSKRWTETFDSEEKAKARIREINFRNTSPTAPDWYQIAEEKIKVEEVK
jgi:hypothetical protein